MRLLRYCAIGVCAALCARGVDAFVPGGPPSILCPGPRGTGAVAHQVNADIGLSGSRGHEAPTEQRAAANSAWTPPEGYVPRSHVRKTRSPWSEPDMKMPAETAGAGRRASPMWQPPVGYVPRRGQENGKKIKVHETLAAYDDSAPLPDTAGWSVRERILLLQYILSNLPEEGKGARVAEANRNG
jgi:hypothetical protein